jgi:hypothetical protein
LTEVAVGLAEGTKLGARTTSCTDPEWVRLPLVAVTVSAKVPPEVGLVVTLKVDVAVPPAETFTDWGLSEQVMPDGQLILRSTAPLNPLSEVRVKE